MASVVTSTLARFGRLDVVFANAGIANDPPATMVTTPFARYERVIEVDLLGVVRTIKPALPEVIANRGHILIHGVGVLVHETCPARDSWIVEVTRSRPGRHSVSALWTIPLLRVSAGPCVVVMALPFQLSASEGDLTSGCA
jgi:NAD(P)-dependent dehydrogenase (short-subunit alcohol dehydrogenase family)